MQVVANPTPLQTWLAFLSPIASTVTTGFLAYLVARSHTSQVASNTRQEANLIEIRTFTNSALGASLKIAAVAMRRLANITNLPEDRLVADKAEASAAAHEAAQVVVDRQNAAKPVQ